MKTIVALSRLLAIMILMAIALVLAPARADAHAGHVHAAVSLSQEVTQRSLETASTQLHLYFTARTPSSGQSVAVCTANCCAAGMGCCAALMVFPTEFRAPHERLSLRDMTHDNRTGIEPDVPPKPPRLARDQGSSAA